METPAFPIQDKAGDFQSTSSTLSPKLFHSTNRISCDEGPLLRNQKRTKSNHARRSNEVACAIIRESPGPRFAPNSLFLNILAVSSFSPRFCVDHPESKSASPLQPGFWPQAAQKNVSYPLQLVSYDQPAWRCSQPEAGSRKAEARRGVKYRSNPLPIISQLRKDSSHGNA
jgi:hypothetical protein